MSDPTPTRTEGTDGHLRARRALGDRGVLGRRWVRVVVALAVLLGAAALIADHVELGYYVLLPGNAQPVTPLVRVPGARSRQVHGELLLTDVYVTQVSALGYLADRLDGDAQLVPIVTLLGPDVAPSELVPQGYLEMAQSQAGAKAAALASLGYRVTERSAGALVYAVVPGSPASKVLAVGRIVTAVDGTATPDACAFAQTLATRRPGQRVTLSIEQSHVTSRAEIVSGPVVRRTTVLARWPKAVARSASSAGCPLPATAGARGFLGVEVQTQQRWHYPFRVSVRTTAIGGPSAGLAMALGIVDELSTGRLTGGRTVAVTGTIDRTGAVGEVGGVAQKTVAAERAGATVFIVPAGQRATAMSRATPRLHVYGVTSLAEALGVLRRLGGAVPAVHR